MANCSTCPTGEPGLCLIPQGPRGTLSLNSASSFTVPERAGDPLPCSYLVTPPEKTTPIGFSQAKTIGLWDQILKT